MTEATAPLDGIVVVAVEQAIAAPFATRQLADLGASVVKVEPPTGDLARHYDAAMAGQSVNFAWANRGKQSVALDLHDPDDRAILDSLIAGADVFVHNLAPGHRTGAGPRRRGTRGSASDARGLRDLRLRPWRTQVG